MSGDTSASLSPDQPTGFSAFNLQANRKLYKEFIDQRQKDREYIEELESLLQKNGIKVPEKRRTQLPESPQSPESLILKDGSMTSLEKAIERIMPHIHHHEMHVHFRNLTFWNEVTEAKIPTVGSTFKSIFAGSGPKHRVDIISNMTGRIATGTMTLVMGPPGCGKTTFLKALAGQLNIGSAHLDGDILYNGDRPDSGKFLLGKIATYVDEKEQHAATLTVRETFEFAWLMTTGGHHGYQWAKNEESAAFLNKNDAIRLKMQNVMRVLGLSEVGNTVVGDGMLKGVSGGQKRRVTMGEMAMAPRSVAYMDAISNGLDASTTLDIIRAMRFLTTALGSTNVVSLLQPAPEVFETFQELILMNEGHIIYQGPTAHAREYFERLGYECPESTDVPDFLQELPTPDGKRFIPKEKRASTPVGSRALSEAWQNSDMFKEMEALMDEEVLKSKAEWPAVFNEYYPASLWFSFTHCLDRQVKITVRDSAFLKGRFMQSVVVGSIAGSLFSDLETDDTNTMNGVLFFACLFNALSAMAMMPMIFNQRTVFYKHSRNLFYPTRAFVLAQTIVLYPLQIVETITFASIVYWSVGLSDEGNGSRYFTFMLILFAFGLISSQLFRLLASITSAPTVAQPLGGVMTILMVLFSGYIIPKSDIPPGWIWFYWINPVAYALKAVTVNEFIAKDYDSALCTSFDSTGNCLNYERFGDVVLDSRGNPTEQAWVWYSVAILFGEYLLLLGLTTLALVYVRIEPTPPPPIYVEESNESEEDTSSGAVAVGGKLTAAGGEEEAAAEEEQIPFEAVAFSFKDVWYTVTLAGGEELDLLQGVDGYFEPGTVTALMGSSGAGKTTLLDVLAGRKNTGVVQGGMFINGKPKNEATFRHIMGYVEQFDSLSPHDTAREAIEFSAALRLPGDTTHEKRQKWVTSVLTLLELLPLQNTMIGSEEMGGMSFEQKKRVSIGVELAANPSILFLDEPTSGLDSRAAQVVIRCIKRVASSGRSIVCTIHQPSAVIFEAFDSLLLLRRGGQTVFFGELGEGSKHLVEYFEKVPNVPKKAPQQNPAAWMLEVIGAGTQGSAVTVDFHQHYNASTLCGANTTHVDALCQDADAVNVEDLQATTTSPIDINSSESAFLPVFCSDPNAVATANGAHPLSKYNATYARQFQVVMRRTLLAYWRSPSYNFARMAISILIALIFASTFANQSYTSDVDVISRVALIYITVLFMGVIGMSTVQSVVFDERPAFYREQFSQMYDVKLYVLAATLVEIPYLLLSSVIFVIPFFFIVGFDKDGTAEKFFWYWLFQALYMSVMVFLGHLLASALPNSSVSNVLGGMCSTCISLFAGFMILPQNFPTFWIFMYWLDPLHYALEGLVVTQFNKDDTPVSITGSPNTVTANTYIQTFFSEWEYRHRGLDMFALLLIIVLLRIAAYFSLEYVRHDKR